VKLDGQSIEDSEAITIFSFKDCGTNAQPIRRPGAIVFENVPRYITFSESLARIALGDGLSKPNKPYGLSSTIKISSALQISKISLRRSAGSNTPAGFW